MTLSPKQIIENATKVSGIVEIDTLYKYPAIPEDVSLKAKDNDFKNKKIAKSINPKIKLILYRKPVPKSK
mgnify:CR=1 FL=1